MDTIIDLLKVEYVCSKHSGVTCLFVAVGAYVIILKILGVWLYKPEMLRMVAPLQFDYIK